MDITAIIAEFNPFHNGHSALLKKIKIENPQSIITVIMSGSFVQRGLPAIIDKWSRAEAALKNGADLILELPYFISASPARDFSEGAVRIAEFFGANTLAFGSETGDLSLLKRASEVSLEFGERHSEILRRKRLGYSYSESMLEILSEKIPNVIKGSNDILAIEYIRTILLNDFKIKPVAIKREEEKNYLSASSIREKILSYDFFSVKKNLPENSLKAIKKYSRFPTLEYYFPNLIYLITATPKEKLYEIYTARDDLVNSVSKARKNFSSVPEIIAAANKKNRSVSMLCRFFLNLLIGLTKEKAKMLKGEEVVFRVLGANKKGFMALKNKNAVVKFKNKNSKVLELEKLATDLYYLAVDGSINRDLTTSPIIIDA